MKYFLSIGFLLYSLSSFSQSTEVIYLKNPYKKALFKSFAKIKKIITTTDDSVVTTRVKISSSDTIDYEIYYLNTDQRIYHDYDWQNGNKKTTEFFSKKFFLSRKIYFFKEGGKNYESNFSLGMKNGIEIEYYKSGEKRRETFFENGEKNGECKEYYKSGETKMQFNYKNGVRDGTILEFAENGQIIDSSFVKNGVKDGEQIIYYQTGEVMIISAYDNGKIMGKEFYYHKNGLLKKEINYKDFKKNGKVLIFDENGKIKDSVTYIDGDYEGNVNYWYESGELKSTRTYKKGKTSGDFIVYHKNGNIKRREKYENGEFISGKCFDANNKDTAFYEYFLNPEYPGGVEKLFEYLALQVKYPKRAKENGTKGKVYVQFVVEKDGEITDVKVIRGIGNGCDDEARRAVQNMPNWNPGTQDNQPVRVRFTLPVNFTLR